MHPPARSSFRIFYLPLSSLVVGAVVAACGDAASGDPSTALPDTGGTVGADAEHGSGAGGRSGGGGEALGGAGGSPGGSATGGATTSACPDPQVFNPWLAREFEEVEELTGDFTSRQTVELPRLVRDASGTNAKYAFDLREQSAPDDPRAAFVNVDVTDLSSSDAWGAAIQTSGAPGATLFLSNVYIEPNWPEWQNYQTTNYDGVVLDGSDSLYAENLTVKNWNADSALDIKSSHTQFVCLKTEGNGNRTLRFWQPGPHYLVHSELANATGVLLWFANCDTATVYVYESSFNGAPEVSASDIGCEEGAAPEIVYLTDDPRMTGDLHPMFSR